MRAAFVIEHELVEAGGHQQRRQRRGNQDRADLEMSAAGIVEPALHDELGLLDGELRAGLLAGGEVGEMQAADEKTRQAEGDDVVAIGERGEVERAETADATRALHRRRLDNEPAEATRLQLVEGEVAYGEARVLRARGKGEIADPRRSMVGAAERAPGRGSR